MSPEALVCSAIFFRSFAAVDVTVVKQNIPVILVIRPMTCPTRGFYVEVFRNSLGPSRGSDFGVVSRSWCERLSWSEASKKFSFSNSGPGPLVAHYAFFSAACDMTGKKNKCSKRTLKKVMVSRVRREVVRKKTVNEFVDIFLGCSLAWNIQINHFL